MKKNFLFTILVVVFVFFAFNHKTTLDKQVERIHKKALSVDSHTDTPFWFDNEEYDFGKDNSAHTRSKVDLPRMKSGGLDAVFLASFVGQGPRTKEGNARVIQKNAEIIQSIYRVVKENSELAEIALTPKDAYRLKKEGKRAIFIGIENGYTIGNDLSLIEENYNKGARYITLCHTKNNDICDSSTDQEEHQGLSKFGEKVVLEMNRLGMLVDVSHISDKSLEDVFKISRSPVIASHSCAKAVCDHPRNLSDELLLKLKENGGVIQMCILSAYVKKPKPNPVRDSLKNAVRKKYRNFENLTKEEMNAARKEWYGIDKTHPAELATVSDVVDHIDHIVNLIGIDHIGIGTDFDGGGGVKGCYHVGEMKNITKELIKRGYSKKEIIKIWGGNFMRVFKENIEIAKKLN